MAGPDFDVPGPGEPILDNPYEMPDWDVSLVTDMHNLFEDVPNQFNLDLSRWNTAAVNDMKAMFRGATSFNRDLSPWDVSLVEINLEMFEGANAMELSNQPCTPGGAAEE